MLAFLAAIDVVAWFWVISIISFITIATFVERENGVWATITLVVTLVVINLLSKYNISSAALHHPFTTLGYIGIYFVAGTAWGFAKWFLYVQKKLDRYVEFRNDFLTKENIKGFTTEAAEKFQSELDYANRGKRNSYSIDDGNPYYSPTPPSRRQS